MQFKSIGLCHTFQRSPGFTNLATHLNAVQDRRTLLYIPKQLRTLELGYMFQSGSGLSNFATRSNANQDPRTLP